MNVLSDFIIPIIGLKLGNHTYEFEVDGTFFKEFEHSELKQGFLNINLLLIKRSNLFELIFEVKGYVNSLCDRCGEEMKFYLDHKERRIMKFSHDDYSNTDEVEILREDEHEINVSHMIYEIIVLALPYRRLHTQEDGQSCDQDVLNKLEEYKEREDKNVVDDRWSALKDLLTEKE